MATCFISTSGLKVTVEQAKCVQVKEKCDMKPFLSMAIQANAFIQSAMFQEYKYNDDTPCVFRINLNALIVSNIQKIILKCILLIRNV